MTVKEFAAFTGMSPSKIRTEIRAKNLQATMTEKTVVDGVTTPAHYEITEDPTKWLKKRNTPQENPQDQQTTASQDSQEKSPRQNHQQSKQEQDSQGTSLWAVLGWVALGVGVLGILYAEYSRNY
jgi:cation transport ATPase